MKMQDVRGHLWASVGVLLSPRGMHEPEARVPRAGGVEKVDQGVAPSGVVPGPLFAAAVVEVLVGALIEAHPHRRWPWVVVVREGVVRRVVPVPGHRVWHRYAARVAVPQLGCTQRDNVARGGPQLDVGRPGARDGVVEPHPRAARARGTPLTLSPPARAASSGTG